MRRPPDDDDENAPALRWWLLVGSPAPEGWPQRPTGAAVAETLEAWTLHGEELATYWRATPAERAWRGQGDGDAWPVPRIPGRPCFAELLEQGVAWEQAQQAMHEVMGWPWSPEGRHDDADDNDRMG